MKKLLYLTPVQLDSIHNAGIRQKVFGQISAFKELGFDVELIYISGEQLIKKKTDGTSKILLKYNGLLKHLSQWNYYRHVKNLGDVELFDIIYIRYHIPTPSFIKTLQWIKTNSKSSKILCEIATYPYDKEFTGIKGIIYKYLDNKYNKIAGRYYDNVLSFYPADMIFGVKPIIIENAVPPDVLRFGQKHVRDNQSKKLDRINIVGLAANLESFHGYDRVVRGIATYNDSKEKHLPGVYFTILSQGEEFNNLINLTNKLNLNQYIHFRKPTFGQELHEFISTMDVGVATISRFKVGLDTDNSLKSREYCALGLPFILSAKDRSFPEGLEFVHYVPNNDVALNINEIVDWFSILNSTEYKSKMLSYADTNLSWKTQMEKVLDCI